MLQGITDKWKQQVGYFLTEKGPKGSQLLTMVKECVQKCKNIGLQVKALISDQGGGELQRTCKEPWCQREKTIF